MIVCRSSAKVNLTLDILGLRADGYHELQSVAHTIGLWDTLFFEFGIGHGFSLRCNRLELGGDDNLCLRAARAWLSEAHKKGGVRLRDLRITLQKSIPTGAGLGGGSGNAAAVLLALNSRFGNCLHDDEMHSVAATLGADVPLFLRGGCILMEGIGEKLTSLSSLEGWLVLVQPQQALSTPAIYRQWDEMKIDSTNSTPNLQRALPTNNLHSIAATLGNDLGAAAQAQGVPVELMVSALREQGALGASMTGSGSCVFGLFASEEEACRAAQQLNSRPEKQIFRQVLVAPFVQDGVAFLEEPFVEIQPKVVKEKQE